MIPNWVRYQFLVPTESYPEMNFIDRWLENNIEGRWGSYLSSTPEGVRVVIVFELLNDAIMFRLKEGETAWKDEKRY